VHRTLFPHVAQEQLLWIRHFPNLAELRVALAEFRGRYTKNWILERLAYRTPAQARRDFSVESKVAA